MRKFGIYKLETDTTVTEKTTDGKNWTKESQTVTTRVGTEILAQTIEADEMDYTSIGSYAAATFRKRDGSGSVVRCGLVVLSQNMSVKEITDAAVLQQTGCICPKGGEASGAETCDELGIECVTRQQQRGKKL